MDFKNNSKIRFRNSDFKTKLSKAQNYKRVGKKIPENITEYFFEKLGLQSLLSKLFLLFIFLSLLTFVYAPFGFWKIKKIKIESNLALNPDKTLSLTSEFLHSNYAWPQSNFFLLDTDALKNFLGTKSIDIKKIIKIQKEFPDTLKIFIDYRQPEFVIKAPNGEYTVSGDGMVFKKISNGDLSSQRDVYSGLPLILYREKLDLYENRLIDPNTLTSKISLINQYFTNRESIDILHYEILNPKTGDIGVKTARGFTIFFNSQQETEKNFLQLELLEKNLSDQQKENLEYIDLRIKNRGYVCLKFTTCSLAPDEPKATTTNSTFNTNQ